MLRVRRDFSWPHGGSGGKRIGGTAGPEPRPFQDLPMTRKFLFWLLLATAPPALAATDPGMPGEFTPGRQNSDIPVTGGATRNTDIYFPAAGGGVDPDAGLCPVVVFGHGFSRNKDRYNDFGDHLASRGFIVMIANNRCGIFTGCDHSTNADEMRSLIDWILARHADPGSIFFNRVNTARIGTSGHSAGGLQALVAAVRDPRVTAVAPMDPVDSGGLGVGSLPLASLPVAITYSEPSSCNAQGSALDLYTAANPQKRGVKLIGANHCDPEKNLDFFGCALTCGAWNAERHLRYLRFVTGWFEFYLHCDPEYKEWVVGNRVALDLGAGLITYHAALNPPAPRGLTALWNSAVVLNRETPVQCQGVDFWQVFRRELPAGEFALVADGLPPSTTTWNDPASMPGHAYEYFARDLFGDFQETFASADSHIASITAPASRPEEASPPGLPLLVRPLPGSWVEVDYSPAPCATGHTAYWNTCPGPLSGLSWTGQACGLGSEGTASFDPGRPAPGSVLYFVLVGEDGQVEGSYGQDSAGHERPEALGLSACDFPQQLAGSCP